MGPASYKGAERVTMARVEVGDHLRTSTVGGALANAGKITPGREPGDTVRRVVNIDRNVTPSVNGSPHVVEYVLHFEDGATSEPRYGTTSWHKVPAEDVTDATSTAPAKPGRDESGRVIVREVPLQGMSSDPERRALDATDAEADARMAEEGGQDAADGERCEPCKGFGLVRGVGKNAGGRYKTLAGAHAAQDAGRAVDCPTCGGLGLVGLKVDEESADSETVPV